MVGHPKHLSDLKKIEADVRFTCSRCGFEDDWAPGELAGGAPALQPEGSAGRSRTTAWCTTRAGVDLSRPMVASRTAARWQRYWKDHRCP